MELGGILKARDREPGSSVLPRPPITHRLFSSLGFTFATPGDALPLGESELNSFEESFEEDYVGKLPAEKQESGGWLDSDDIEEF